MDDQALGGQVAVVRFAAGGHRFAIETRRVRAMRLDAVPGAPVVEDLLGLAHGGGKRRCLMLDGDHCLDVAEPVVLGQVAAAAIRLPPALVRSRCALTAVVALAVEADGALLLLLDAPRLFNPPPR